jgi:glycosyltransferase involved in cell wall biosynthesis
VRIVHLADPSVPGGGACALAELAGVLRHAQGASHTVVLIGQRRHEQLARRCGLPVHLRVPLPAGVPSLARKTLAVRAAPLIDRQCVIVAWAARAAAIAASAWPGVHVLARLSVGPMPVKGLGWFLGDSSASFVSTLPATAALAQACVKCGFDSQGVWVLPPGIDLLSPGMAARVEVRRRWGEEFAMIDDAFVVGLLGEPVSWPDARMAVEIVARVALSGRKVKLLMHPAVSRRLEAITLLRRLNMREMVMETDDLAEPWRVLAGMDAALVLGVDFRAIGNAIRSAVRPGIDVGENPEQVPTGDSQHRRPSPSVSPIAWSFAAGVPVVAHDLPSNREVIEHDVTGLLAGERNMNGVSDGLARLHDDWPLRQRLTTAAGRIAKERFGMSALAEQLMQACEDVRNGRPIGGQAAQPMNC